MVVIASIMGQIMAHCTKVRSIGSDAAVAIHQELAQEHTRLDNTITNTFLFLPENLRFSDARKSPLIAFLNTCLHAASICLHLAEIDRLVQHTTGAERASLSQRRCRAAAQEILSVLRLTAHIDPAQVSNS